MSSLIKELLGILKRLKYFFVKCPHEETYTYLSSLELGMKHCMKYFCCSGCKDIAQVEMVENPFYDEPIKIKSMEEILWEQRMARWWNEGARQRQIDKWFKLEQAACHETP